jgi:hypothetical protein
MGATLNYEISLKQFHERHGRIMSFWCYFSVKPIPLGAAFRQFVPQLFSLLLPDLQQERGRVNPITYFKIYF